MARVIFVVGAAAQREGIDFLELRSRTIGSVQHITHAIMCSDADASRLRDWATSVGVVVESGAVRVATDAELSSEEQSE